MQQIVFLTVFLGLVAGRQAVELIVPAGVAKVELRLDGRTVSRLNAPPWKATIDFGDALLPHRLEAVAFDGSGAAAGAAVQKINAGAPPRELQLALEEANGRPRARIIWSHLDAQKPEEIKARIDGQPVDVARDRTIALPATTDGRVHLVEVSVRTAKEESDAQLVFGAMFADTTSAELTAVPVRVRQKKTPGLDDVACTAGGRDLEAIALDHLPAQVIFVRDPSTNEAATKLYAAGRRQMATMQGMGVAGATQSNEGSLTLAAEDRVRFLWPAGRPGQGAAQSMLFFPSRWYSTTEGTDVRVLLTSLSVPIPPGERRYADAVAVAGLQAAQSQRPRAVVLVLGSSFRDASRLTPAATRTYLGRLGVPLYVWSLAAAPPVDWGTAIEIGTTEKLRSAIGLLRRDLDAQRMLWVEGDYLVHEVAVKSESVETLVR